MPTLTADELLDYVEKWALRKCVSMREICRVSGVAHEEYRKHGKRLDPAKLVFMKDAIDRF